MSLMAMSFPWSAMMRSCPLKSWFSLRCQWNPMPMGTSISSNGASGANRSTGLHSPSHTTPLPVLSGRAVFTGSPGRRNFISGAVTMPTLIVGSLFGNVMEGVRFGDSTSG